MICWIDALFAYLNNTQALLSFLGNLVVGCPCSLKILPGQLKMGSFPKRSDNSVCKIYSSEWWKSPWYFRDTEDPSVCWCCCPWHFSSSLSPPDCSAWWRGSVWTQKSPPFQKVLNRWGQFQRESGHDEDAFVYVLKAHVCHPASQTPTDEKALRDIHSDHFSVDWDTKPGNWGKTIFLKKDSNISK